MKEIVLNTEEKTITAETLYYSSIKPTKKGLAIAFIVCYISIMFSGISSMLMSVYLPVAVKDLLGNVTDEKMNTISAYINSIFIFGSMLAALPGDLFVIRSGVQRRLFFRRHCMVCLLHLLHFPLHGCSQVFTAL